MTVNPVDAAPCARQGRLDAGRVAHARQPSEPCVRVRFRSVRVCHELSTAWTGARMTCTNREM